MSFVTVGRSTLLYTSRAHTHDEWEVVLNLEGEGTTQVGERVIPIRSGTVVCVPPHCPHAKEAKGGFRDTFIHFSTLSLPTESPVCFQDEDGRVMQLLDMIHSIGHKKESNHQAITRQLALALEQILVGRLSRTDLDPRVAALTDAMVKNFTDPDFDVARLIRESGYCEDHMRRLFQRELGQSPLAYLTALRMDHARRLMAENSRLHYSIGQIAELAGFSDAAYFSRVFKKHTGHSPRAYVSKKAQNG